MKYLILLFSLTLLLTGCGGVSILPLSGDGAQIDPATQAITQQRNDVAATVRIGDQRVRPAVIEQNFCSFLIEISNQRATSVPVSHKDFVLIDSSGMQVAAYEPAALVALLKPELPYMIPYPYVGYYYLGDQARGSAADQFRSEAYYATSRRPEQISLAALPETDLLPQAKVSGLIYFPVELSTLQGFEIRYQVGTAVGQKSFPISFSFSVEKN